MILDDIYFNDELSDEQRQEINVKMAVFWADFTNKANHQMGMTCNDNGCKYGCQDPTSKIVENFMRGGNHNTRDPHPPGVQVSGPVKLADPRVRDAAAIACELTTTAATTTNTATHTPQPAAINTRLGTNVGDTQGNVLPDMLDVSIGTDGAYIDDGDTYDPQPIANTQANRSEL